MLNRYELVREFVNEGYVVPIDTMVSLMSDGYDVSEFHRGLDGFSVEDLIDMKEMYDN